MSYKPKERVNLMVWNGRAGAGIVQGRRVFTLKPPKPGTLSPVDRARENYLTAMEQARRGLVTMQYAISFREKWEELRGRGVGG